MTESPETREDQNKAPETKGGEPGILENYGSFPVWMLRLIQLITPSFLISKTPPKKKDYRI
jgi:hypothetical protein